MAFRYSPKIVTDGLVLYLDAANPKSFVSGSTTWNDLTSNINNGSLINSPVYSTTDNGGITFDGLDDYVNLGNNSITQFSNNNPWSISITAKLLSQNVTYPGFLIKGNSVTTGILIFYSDNGRIYLKHNNSQPTYVTTTLNTIFQYTVTYSGSGSTRVYLNGIYQNNGPSISSIDTTNNLFLGRGDSYGNVRLYNFLKYNRQLSDNDVLQNYNTIKTRFGL